MGVHLQNLMNIYEPLNRHTSPKETSWHSHLVLLDHVVANLDWASPAAASQAALQGTNGTSCFY